ncbi:hypothetical protein LINGRAHAP2_LOCUS16806 [Linum grandiflorum]
MALEEEDLPSLVEVLGILAEELGNRQVLKP